MEEAYILVHRLGFGYNDIKKMDRRERTSFIALYAKEVEAENNATEQLRSNR